MSLVRPTLITTGIVTELKVVSGIMGGPGTPPVPAPVPVITLNPVDQTVIEGGTVTFESDATDYVSVQWWWSDDLINWSFTNTPEWQVPDLILTDRNLEYDQRNYKAIYTNANGTAETTPGKLTVTPGLPFELVSDEIRVGEVAGYNPSFGSLTPETAFGETIHAVEANNVSGYIRVTFTGSVLPVVDVTFTYGSLVYVIPATASNYQLYNASATTELYNAFIANLGVPVPANFEGEIVPLLPVITLNPVDVNLLDGEEVSFTADATGYDTVQWWQLRTGDTEWEMNLNGTATTTNLVFNFNADNSGWQYKAIFTNVNGSSETTPATATRTLIVPVVTLNPEDQTVVADTNVSFTADATSYNSVKWWHSTDGGVTWVQNENPTSTTTTLTFEAGIEENGRMYKAIFKASDGSDETTSALLTVTPAVPSREYYTFDGVDDLVTIPYVDLTLGDTVAFKVVYHASTGGAFQMAVSGSTSQSWFGIDSTGLFIFDDDVTVEVDGTPISDGVVQAVFEQEYNVVLYATESSFLNYFGGSDAAGENANCTLYDVEITALSGNHFYAIDDGWANNPVIADSVGTNDGVASNFTSTGWSGSVTANDFNQTDFLPGDFA